MSQTMSLTASNTYSLVMNGISGIASVLFFTIRPAAITASNSLTYYAVQDFDIQQADGSSIVGYARRNNTEALWDYAECFDNLFRKNINFNCISFSSDPVSDFTRGTNFGYEPFTSFEKLSFTTPAGLSSASYQIDIIAFVHDNLIIQDQRVKSQRA